MTFNFYQDESSSYDSRQYNFGLPIDGKELAAGYGQKPLISYNFIDIDKTNYCFDQECLDADDILWYFELLKEFSSKTINELIDSDYKKHFHLYHNPNPQLKSLLKSISGVTLRPETTPTIGQFALYTDRELASRKNKIKSPRIYFIVGHNAVMYILFYDPYHEINSKIV